MLVRKELQVVFPLVCLILHHKIETIKNEDVDENQEDIDIRKELESLKTDKDKIQNTYESFELEM